MPVPKQARPTTHRTRRSANRSRIGRSEGDDVPDIVLHRTETVPTPQGSLCTVHYVGVSSHEGEMREAVLRLKYGRKKKVARSLADVVCGALIDLMLVRHQCVVTWAPTTRVRRQGRGFDQSELIARHVAVLLGKPVKCLLRRTSEQVQTGHSRTERLNSPCFISRPPAPKEVNSVIVVDDVMTTGTTMRAVVRELVKNEYAFIVCIAPSHRVDTGEFLHRGK